MARLKDVRTAVLAAVALAAGLHAVPVAYAASGYPVAWSRSADGAGRPLTAAHNSSAAIGDLPAGRLIVAADMSGGLRAMRPDGSIVWEVGVDPYPGLAAAVESSPAIGDLNGDGSNDVVVGAGAIDPRTRRDHGGVVAFDGNGRVRWRFMTQDTLNVYTGGGRDGLSDGVISTPAIGDVDGDGINDVVFGSLDHRIYALRGTDGTLLPGFPVDNGDTVFSSPALYDIDGDGRQEILIGGDATPNPAANWYAAGTFRALDWAAGTVRTTWMRTFDRPRTAGATASGDIVYSSPAVGDIDGDGRPEVVFSSGGYYNDNIDSRRVWAMHVDDGRVLPGWPVATDGLLNTSPALGDVTGPSGAPDGRPDVVIGDRDGAVYAFLGSGARAWKSFPGASARGNNGNGFDGGAVIADLDGDGLQDIALPYGLGGALLVNGRTGALIAVVGGTQFATVGAPAVADFGGQFGRMLVLLGWDPAVADFAHGQISAVRLPSTTVASAWPVFRRDAMRRGAPASGGDPLPPAYCRANSNPPVAPDPAAGSGYWTLARRGGLFTSGSAPFFGAPSGTGLPVPSAAMAGRPQGDGYWAVGDGGAVQDFGWAPWFGDARSLPLQAPVVALVPTSTGAGYWLVGRDGAVFSFGDARFYGSLGSIGVTANSPVTAAARSASGAGYYLVTANGAVFTFGDAAFHGAATALRDPVVSIGVSPTGAGYWLLARDGGVFSFDVPYAGSIAGLGLCTVPDLAVSLVPTRTGKGYWIVAQKGGVFTFGDAPFRGAPGVGVLGTDTLVSMVRVP